MRWETTQSAAPAQYPNVPLCAPQWCMRWDIFTLAVGRVRFRARSVALLLQSLDVAGPCLAGVVSPGDPGKPHFQEDLAEDNLALFLCSARGSPNGMWANETTLADPA